MFAEAEAELLLDAAAGDDDLLARLTARRCAGEPLEHVVGFAELHGRRYAVEPGVFVPRVRSELLVTVAVEHLARRDGAVVVDLCCGSGALRACVADLAGAPIELHAADLDPAACACARQNVDARGGRVWRGDLLDALPADLRGGVDVLLANVPYVASGDLATLPAQAREHEPRLALDGGDDGLDVLRRVAADAGGWLTRGGVVLFEVAGHQLASASEAIERGGLAASERRDDELDAIVVVGRRA